MSEQKVTRQSITAVFGAMLVGSVLMALIGTFAPPYIGLDPDTTMMMRIVCYAGAVLGVGQAFWLKAKLTKQLPPDQSNGGERKSGGTVQRQ